MPFRMSEKQFAALTSGKLPQTTKDPPTKSPAIRKAPFSMSSFLTKTLVVGTLITIVAIKAPASADIPAPGSAPPPVAAIAPDTPDAPKCKLFVPHNLGGIVKARSHPYADDDVAATLPNAAPTTTIGIVLKWCGMQQNDERNIMWRWVAYAPAGSATTNKAWVPASMMVPWTPPNMPPSFDQGGF